MPNACVLTEYGPPSVLEWAEVVMPEPSKGEIRIKAIVSGVGPTDLKIRRGNLTAVYLNALSTHFARFVCLLHPALEGP
jgi:NADPH:quinone reductase-like Zn-dependent oxidoreductase